MPDNIRAIDCQNAVRQLWDYLDAELDDQRMTEVKQHLDTCRHCLEHAEFGQRFIQALKRVRDRHVMPSAVRSQVIAVLSAAGFSAE
ncbi:MAG TPA: zf-HC2 domain-containing protein [Gemmatimonadaceae bacterium]